VKPHLAAHRRQQRVASFAAGYHALAVDMPPFAPPLRDALVSATLTNPRFTARLLRGLVSDPAAVTAARVAMLQRPLYRERTTTTYGEWFRHFLLVDEHTLATDRARYRTIRVPALVIWGSADAVTPVAQGRDIARLIPGANWLELPGVGHIPAIEATDRFDASLVGWLQRQEPAGLSTGSR
jgi:pimeloyl-ACP methyl ester carboxylesterase